MFFVCGIWCVADVSRVSPSSEQTAPTSILTGEKHTISTFAGQTRIQLTRQHRKKTRAEHTPFHRMATLWNSRDR